jgi:hypothetical protein
MNTTLGWTLSVGLVLAGGLAGVGQIAADGSPETGDGSKFQIVVHVANRVHMTADRLAQVEDMTTQILRQAGVQPRWLDCTVAKAQDYPSPACDSPLGRNDFILNFVEEIRSLSPKVIEGTLGFAMVHDGSDQGNTAYISIRRVRHAAGESATSVEMILGFVAAHEIGHLLLGSREHSRSGVMRACWDVKDIRRAAKGDLRFTDNQVRKIRARALAREDAAR